MKTLIIHPNDDSTSFLTKIYENIENKTVITGGEFDKTDIRNLIKDHDQVMMMGHGCPYGLFSTDSFPMIYGLIIDQSMVSELNEKNNSVFIWCNANVFVEKFKLQGFYSGMFISEVGEAAYCGLPNTTQDMVDESNFGFCRIASKHITKSINDMYDGIIKEYREFADINPVALYNFERLHKHHDNNTTHIILNEQKTI
jgi:hypothetical protein